MSKTIYIILALLFVSAILPAAALPLDLTSLHLTPVEPRLVKSVQIDLTSLHLTPMEPRLVKSVQIDLTSLHLTPMEPRLVKSVQIDLTSLHLTPVEPRLVKSVQIDLTSLHLTPMEPRLVKSVQIDLTSLHLTPMEPRLVKSVQINLSSLHLTPMEPRLVKSVQINLSSLLHPNNGLEQLNQSMQSTLRLSPEQFRAIRKANRAFWKERQAILEAPDKVARHTALLAAWDRWAQELETVLDKYQYKAFLEWQYEVSPLSERPY